MTWNDLLEAFSVWTRETLKELRLPARQEITYKKNPETGEMEEQREGVEVAPVAVYLHRLPDNGNDEKLPYVLHQIVTHQDIQPVEQPPYSQTVVRSVFCVYGSDEQESARLLLNVMERMRIALLKMVVFDWRFTLNRQAGLEFLIYPDSDHSAPYAMGEMISTWDVPPVYRDVFKEVGIT